MSNPETTGHLVSPASGDVTPGTVRSDLALASWELLVVDAVGNVIEFWGFKRNQGRMWALLYLRDAAMTATEIQGSLGLSKGAVSMLSRELERWQVLRRVRRPGDSAWRFAAATDLLRMIHRVLAEREIVFLGRVAADLAAAERAARAAADVAPEVVDRVTRMRRLAEVVEKAVRVLSETSRLDISGLVGVLHATGRRMVTR